MNKTIVLKTLEQKKINYQYFEYDEAITDGVMVATTLGENPHQVFKTLVTTNGKNQYFVFIVPVVETLDVKKVAKLTNNKSIDMIKQKDLEPLTGYVHGGCSPIGMKKRLPTYLDESALKFDEICISGGRRGLQIKIKVQDLINVTGLSTGDLILKEE